MTRRKLQIDVHLGTQMFKRDAGVAPKLSSSWQGTLLATNNMAITCFVEMILLPCVSLHFYEPIVLDSFPHSNPLQHAPVMSGA